MKVPWLRALAALSLLAVALPADALRRDYYFTPLGAEQGLTQGTVQAIVQDPRGFVWVGTQGGLQRYDGERFETFGQPLGESGGLPEAFVTALAVGADGRLWVGSNDHFVSALDLDDGSVSAGPRVEDPARDRVVAIEASADGVVWVGTASGIERYLPATGERREMLRFDGPARADPRGLPRVVDFARDGDRLLVASDGGLLAIDADGGVERIVDSAAAAAVHRDGEGRVWVGGGAGLAQLEGDALRPVVGGDGGPLPAVRRIASDPHGRLWLSLRAGGLLRLDPRDGSSLRMSPQRLLPGALHDGHIGALVVDRGGVLWVGGEVNGLATTPVDGQRFAYFTELADAEAAPAANSVRALHAAGEGRFWVGSLGDSLRRVELATGASEEFAPVLHAALPAPAPSGGLRIQGLADGPDGALWVATDVALFALDPDGRRAVVVSPPDEQAHRIDGVVAYRSLLRARDGTIWLGSHAAGLLAYDPAVGRWQRFGPGRDPHALGGSPVLALFEDARGRIWVGGMDGAWRHDPATGRSEHFAHAHAAGSLSSNIVRAFAETADGDLWIASHGGLDRVEEVADGSVRFHRVGVAEGLPSDTVYGVLAAADGALWLSGNLGLARFSPDTGSVQRYGVVDGLQDLEFNGGAQLALADGRLLFGGIRGSNLIDPAAASASAPPPAVALTKLQVGERGAERPLLSTPASIDFPQAERVLRLHFAALDFAAPGSHRFQHRLDGFDPDWVDRGAVPEVTYTNLDPGSYRLLVRASDRDGRFGEPSLVLPIEVVPAWWNSLAARLGYGLVALLIAVVLWRALQRRRRQEQALMRELAQREQRLKLALWGSGDEFWDWDIAANVLHRIGADQLLGRPAEEDVSTDEWRNRSVHPDDLARVQALLQAHITGQLPAFESEHRVRNAQGEWIWVRSRGKVVERDAAGNALRIAGTARDVTESRRAERDRRVASEVLRSMGEAVAVVDLDYRFVSVNPAFSRMTGYAEDEVLGQPSALLDSPQQAPEFYRDLRETAERVGHWKGEIWQRRKNGEEFLGWIELSEVRDAAGTRTHFVAVVADITDQKRAELELRYLANYDTLTGLPNRTLLGERLERAVARARRQSSRVGVLFLDLDRFKDVNDTMGHAVGDRILKAAAARLQETVRDNDTVARLGGDEFTVVLEGLPDIATAELMAERVVRAFGQPLEVEGRAETSISPSVGVAVFPDHAVSPAELLKFADTAMYRAKDRGRNTWQTYTEAMDAETRRRASMLAALRKALDRGEFSLLFQPKMSLLDNRITGVEALLRWQSGEVGPVSPATFIPLAEETGMIVQIGEWVLREAAATLARWRRAGHHDLVMAVNISVLQLLRGNLPEHVATVLEESGVPANRLELEVTESMVMANAEQAIRAMRELKELGVSLAIDDFGTGYSSLIYLKRLPIDTLKIDKAFVGDITTDPDDEAITATIITMAHSLGLNVVAEGAEALEQLHYLREQGCDEIQGYWLSWPLDAGRCIEFIRGWRPERALAAAPGDAAS